MSRWVLLVAGIVGASAGATTIVAVDVEQLAKGSDAVVQGRVLRTESRWTEDRMRIVTEIEVKVDEPWKGAPGTSVVVVQPGGVVGDIGQRVSGLASFSKGEEVVLFLERRGQDRYLVSGMAQGKYRVDREGERLTARPEPTGDALLLDARTGQAVQRLEQPLALGDLKRRVRAAIQAQPPQSPQSPQAPTKTAPGSTPTPPVKTSPTGGATRAP